MHSFAKSSLRNAGKAHGGSRPKTAPLLSGLKDQSAGDNALSSSSNLDENIAPVIQHLGGSTQRQRSYVTFLLLYHCVD